MALIITPNTHKHPDIIILDHGHQMETKHLSLYRNRIFYKTQNKNSYQVYLEDIHHKLQTENTHKVYVSSDGVYHQINLLTLYNSNDTKIHH